MSNPHDSDLVLQSLRDELRAQITALNELHHPVYPSAPHRIAELERLVADLRTQIAARRSELTASGT
jgi:hypothetical protein